MALRCQHFQFYVADGKLSCQLYQRSADIFSRRAGSTSLVCPSSYANDAQVCGLNRRLRAPLGDAHLYLNHLEQADKQLARTPHPLRR